jgi:hypothetical protein
LPAAEITEPGNSKLAPRHKGLHSVALPVAERNNQNDGTPNIIAAKLKHSLENNVSKAL